MRAKFCARPLLNGSETPSLARARVWGREKQVGPGAEVRRLEERSALFLPDKEEPVLVED